MPKERRGLRFGLDDHLEGIVISEKQNLEEGIVKYPYEVPAKKKCRYQTSLPHDRRTEATAAEGDGRATQAPSEDDLIADVTSTCTTQPNKRIGERKRRVQRLPLRKILPPLCSDTVKYSSST
jgi:hypothetical protein